MRRQSNGSFLWYRKRLVDVIITNPVVNHLSVFFLGMAILMRENFSNAVLLCEKICHFISSLTMTTFSVVYVTVPSMKLATELATLLLEKRDWLPVSMLFLKSRPFMSGKGPFNPNKKY